MTTTTVAPVPRLRGVVRVPGDKSASHRALLAGALADGPSRVVGLSPGADVRATRSIVAQLGAICRDDGDDLVVTGPSGGLRPAPRELECANSGTTMRLVAGVLSAIDGQHVLVGDASLSLRPMDRVAVPLRSMGATVEGHGPRITAPLRIVGGALRGVTYEVPVASAQVKSAILLAGLVANGVTVVHEPLRTRSTTEDMLARAGVAIESVDVGDGRRVTLHPGRPRPVDWSIPGDPSQAAFFAVLGLIHRDAEIEVASIDVAPERIGFVHVLRRMGAELTLTPDVDGASLRAVRSKLRATSISSHEIPSVDEVPALTVAAAAAEGVTAFRAMGELRVKESDRLAGAVALAGALGARAWSDGDDFFVEGLGDAGQFASFTHAATLDHRMVMAAAIAGVAGHGCLIEGSDTVATSFPGFFDELARLT